MVYALVALSMTMVYRATTVVNFGHGDLVMGGAFVVYVLVVYARLPYLLGGLWRSRSCSAWAWRSIRGSCGESCPALTSRSP